MDVRFNTPNETVPFARRPAWAPISSLDKTVQWKLSKGIISIETPADCVCFPQFHPHPVTRDLGRWNDPIMLRWDFRCWNFTFEMSVRNVHVFNEIWSCQNDLSFVPWEELLRPGIFCPSNAEHFVHRCNAILRMFQRFPSLQKWVQLKKVPAMITHAHATYFNVINYWIDPVRIIKMLASKMLVVMHCSMEHLMCLYRVSALREAYQCPTCNKDYVCIPRASGVSCMGAPTWSSV